MIKYKGKEYPTRTFTMTSEETGEVTYTIADTTLGDELDEHGEISDKDKDEIDSEIYFYVDAGVLNLSAEEICQKHLDIPFEFISEEE